MTSFIRERRSISTNATNQGNNDTCWAHTIARMLTRYFKIYCQNYRVETDVCDHFYALSETDMFLDGTYATYLNNDAKCKDTYDRHNLILYMFFYTLATKKFGFGSYFITDALNYVIKFIYNPQNITEVILIHNSFQMNPTDVRIIQYYLLLNIHDKIYGSIVPINTLTFDDCKHIINTQNLYLSMYVSIEACQFIRQHNNKVRLPSRMINLNHFVTVEKLDGDWFGAKNSWGDPKLFWFHKDDLTLNADGSIFNISGINYVKLTTGGKLKRSTKKHFKKKRLSKKRK